MTTTLVRRLPPVRQVHADFVVVWKSAFGRFSFVVLKHPPVFCVRHWLSVVVFFCLSGCSSGSLLSDVTRALYQGRFGSGVDATSTASLNPAYRYLRVVVNGSQPLLLVLGYVDPHPQGDIEVWYSADQEVIKIQHGRLVGTAGLPSDWRNVHFTETLPTWAAVSQSPQRLTRVRDETSGYRYGISEQLTVEAVAGRPAIKLPDTLPAAQYTWYRETVSSGDLPAAWYAVGSYQGQQTVVYSFQCLAPGWCLSMQRWPPQKDLS